MPPAKRTKRKNHGETTALRQQSHGGALRNGGTNRGGPGRPPEALRLASREVFAQWLAWAAKQMEEPEKIDKGLAIQIGNTAAKYGLGTTTDNTHRFSRADLEKLSDAELEALAAE